MLRVEDCVNGDQQATGNRVLLWAQIAGLIATAWLVWTFSVAPRLAEQSLGFVLLQAFSYVLLAWAASALIAFFVYMVISMADVGQVVRTSLRSAAPAMWFAPAIILLTALSAPATAAGLALLVNTTRLLVARWRPREHTPHWSMHAQRPFWLAEIESTAGRALPTFTAALAIEAAIVALLWDSPALAAGCVAASAALLTASAMVAGAYRPAKSAQAPHSAFGVLLTVLLAAAISAGGIQVRYASLTAAAPEVVAKPEPKQSVTELYVPPANENGPVGAWGFPGVVLLPESTPRTLVLAPAPAKGPNTAGALIRPLTIPFSGEYWMFQSPWKRPPVGSVLRKGTPRELSFHTTNGSPMTMEARQKLDRPIDLACCGGVQLVVANGGPERTVTLELVLVRASPEGAQSASLGRAEVTLRVDSRSLYGETLQFPIPPALALRSFDEIKVVFHRDAADLHKSARVAIHGFVLLPR
jgi:hypothetical protein